MLRTDLDRQLNQLQQEVRGIPLMRVCWSRKGSARLSGLRYSQLLNCRRATAPSPLMGEVGMRVIPLTSILSHMGGFVPKVDLLLKLWFDKFTTSGQWVVTRSS